MKASKTQIIARSSYSFIAVAIIAVGLMTLNSKLSPKHTVPATSSAASCVVSATLVNQCRPWLAGFANTYPEVASTLKAQTLYHEQRIGRQLDIVHDYRPPGSYALSADDVYFAQRANTTLLVNWKPADPWVQGAGGNATINADIDKMADSIKAVGAHKVMLALYHEPEDNVSSDPNCPKPGGAGSAYKGNSGTPTDYRNMWANVRSRFAARGVTNVVWVMNYMGYVPSWSCIFNDLWPGNNLVDWVLWDPYMSTSGFSAGISPFYNFMSTNSTAAHDYASKPWGLGEWGAMTSLSQAQAESIYDQAKAVVDNNTYPKLKLYDVFDTIGGGDFRVGYSAAGVKDQTEQNHYNSFADDIHFTDTVTSTPTTTPTPTPSPTNAPSPTPRPTPSPSPTSAPKPSPTPTKGLLGDLDGDGHVTGHDVALLLVNWNKTVPPNTGGDLDGNGIVNGHDVALMLINWGK